MNYHLLRNGVNEILDAYTDASNTIVHLIEEASELRCPHCGTRISFSPLDLFAHFIKCCEWLRPRGGAWWGARRVEG